MEIQDTITVISWDIKHDINGKSSVKVVIISVKMGFLDQNIGIQDMKGGYKTVSEKGGYILQDSNL